MLNLVRKDGFGSNFFDPGQVIFWRVGLRTKNLFFQVLILSGQENLFKLSQTIIGSEPGRALIYLGDRNRLGSHPFFKDLVFD